MGILTLVSTQVHYLRFLEIVLIRTIQSRLQTVTYILSTLISEIGTYAYFSGSARQCQYPEGARD